MFDRIKIPSKTYDDLVSSISYNASALISQGHNEAVMMMI